MEIFKDIKDFEGLYKVSNLGNVLSLKSNKILKPSIKKAGYSQITLMKDGKRHSKTIHRLVAEAFIPNPNNYECVLHTIPILAGGTNAVDNLRWGTYCENAQDTVNQGRAKGNIIPCKAIESYNPQTNETIMKFKSGADADRFYGLTPGQAGKVARGVIKSSKGNYFRYI